MKEIKKWLKAGWKDLQEAEKWFRAGWRDPEEALRWYQAGWNDPYIAFDWYSSPYWNDPEEALRWYQAGWNAWGDPELAFLYKEEGVEPEEAFRAFLDSDLAGFERNYEDFSFED